MGLTLTPIASDNFNRANEFPLVNPPWVVASGGGLQVLSDVCAAPTASGFGTETYTGASLPANQYGSMTIGAVPGFGIYECYVRVPTTAGKSCYDLTVIFEGVGSSVATVQSLNSSGIPTTILHLTGLTVTTGDVWSLAVVNSTLIVIQNGTIRGSVVDTTWASGASSGLSIQDDSTPSDTTVTNFAIGSASVSDSISGSVGAAGAGATISYSGQASGSTTADGSGNFSIPGLSSGTYTITPSLSGFAFSPASRNETIVASDISGVTFSASTALSISGSTDSSFTTVTWSGTSSGSTTSDSLGNYIIPNLANGTYTVTPTKGGGVVFTPTSQNVTLSGSSATGINFTSNAPPSSNNPGWLSLDLDSSLRGLRK
jgi:hypothetical protein